MEAAAGEKVGGAEMYGRVKETAAVAVLVLGGMALGAAVFLSSFFAPVRLLWRIACCFCCPPFGHGTQFTTYTFLTHFCTFLPIALTTIAIALALLYLLFPPRDC